MAEQELREHLRLVPAQPGEFRVAIMVEGVLLTGEMLDYSSFGLGALVPYSSSLEEIFSKGGEFSLECTFGKSTFPSKGSAVNCRVIEKAEKKFLRVGFALVSDALPASEHLAKRRRELRLELDEQLSPLAVCEDDYWLGERVFMRVRDVSSHGLALVLPSATVPFMPKQRVWLRLIVPFFGEFKAYVKIAYVRKLNSADKSLEPLQHLVGVVMLRSVADITGLLSEYLFYTHPEFNREELENAGFSHNLFMPGMPGMPGEVQFRLRLIRAQEDSGSSSAEQVHFTVENLQGLAVVSGAIRLDFANNKLVLSDFVFVEKFVNGFGLMQRRSLGVTIARFLLIYADVHSCEFFEIAPEAQREWGDLFANFPQQTAMPGRFLDSLPASCLPELVPLFLGGKASTAGWRGRAIRALAFSYEAGSLVGSIKK